MQIEYLLEKCIADYEALNGEIPLVNADTQTKVVQNNLGGVNNLAVNGNIYKR